MTGTMFRGKRDDAPFIPTPDNCTIDGHKFRAYLAWDQLNWPEAVWLGKSTLMVAVVGYDEAPDDPHWRVPHLTGETFHRVRLKRGKKGKRIAGV